MSASQMLSSSSNSSRKASSILTTVLVLVQLMFHNVYYQLLGRSQYCLVAAFTLPRRRRLWHISTTSTVSGWTTSRSLLMLEELTDLTRWSSSRSRSRSTPKSGHKAIVDDTDTSMTTTSDETCSVVEASGFDLKRQKYRRLDLDGQSLIDQTIAGMQTDEVFLETTQKLATLGQKRMSLEERKHRRRALDTLGIPNFRQFVMQQQQQQNLPTGPDSKKEEASLEVLRRKPTQVLQLNIGLYCNQACNHCHVESSPKRTESMTVETAARCLELLKNSPEVTTLDITGGAPELNPNFRFLVQTARALRPNEDDLDIIDRCNLTVLLEPGQTDLVEFLKTHRVHVIASLPCYSKKNVDRQRGKAVFDRSIAALIKLNEAGYGHPETGLRLDLVYNPSGPFLPPKQDILEQQYKEQLMDNYGIVFNNLFTLSNMPIKRFADSLHRQQQMETYMDLLVKNFNFETLNNVMCRTYVSIGHDGKIYDCDFNQQLGLAVGCSGVYEGGKTVFDITTLSELRSDGIRTDNHCYGCTAGFGSSCQGATV